VLQFSQDSGFDDSAGSLCNNTWQTTETMSAQPAADLRYLAEEPMFSYFDNDADPLSRSSASEVFGLSIRSSASGGLALEDLVSRIIDDNPLGFHNRSDDRTGKDFNRCAYELVW
jgi:hypothetical protein